MTILIFWAYNARMVQLGNGLFPIQLSARQHARVCIFLAVVLFALAWGSYYWNESTHYLIYLGLGLLFTVLGFAPLILHALHGKGK